MSDTALTAPAVTPATNAFVENAISSFCERMGLTLEWVGGQRPPSVRSDFLVFLKLSREFSSLEYPLLGEMGHFHSGLHILLEKIDSSIFLCFHPDHLPPLQSKLSLEHGYGHVDLTELAEHLVYGWARPDVTVEFAGYRIEDGIMNAIRADEEGLEQYRRRPFGC